jgi:hypothetical protein
MPARRWKRIVLLLAACAVSPAPGGDAGGRVPDRRVRVQADWQVGSEYRYRATWQREITRWELPGRELIAIEHTGEVQVRVVRRSGAGYELRWEPTLAPGSADPAPVARGDVQAGGYELWRYGLSLALDLALDPSSQDRRVTLVNGGRVEAALTRRRNELLRGLLGGAVGAGPEDTQRDTPPVNATAVVPYVAPLFYCSQLDLNVAEPERWSEAIPFPGTSDTVSIEYRREVVDFDPRSPRVRVKTVTQPDAARWDEILRREVARRKLPETVAEALGQSLLRFETDCTVDRRSGWPVTIEQRWGGSTKAYAGSDLVRFELVEPGAPQPPPRK